MSRFSAEFKASRFDQVPTPQLRAAGVVHIVSHFYIDKYGDEQCIEYHSVDKYLTEPEPDEHVVEFQAIANTRTNSYSSNESSTQLLLRFDLPPVDDCYQLVLPQYEDQLNRERMLEEGQTFQLEKDCSEK
jgi:hypothetical protein